MADYAVDTRTGREVRASRDLPRGDFYICPVCRELVWLRPGKIYKPHFRHASEPESACEEYTGGGLPAPTVTISPVSSEEDSAKSHGLYLTIQRGSWELYLRLRELSDEEVRGVGYRELGQMALEVKSAVHPCELVAKLNAWELRPGLGVARVVVPPRPGYCLEPRARWGARARASFSAEVRGIGPRGELFRPRGDAWIRLSDRSSVVPGESLAFVGESRPPADAWPRLHPRQRGAYRLWTVTIPTSASPSVDRWLAELELGIGSPCGRFLLRNVPGRLRLTAAMAVPHLEDRKALVFEREGPGTGASAKVDTNEYTLSAAGLVALDVSGDRATLAAHQHGEEPLTVALLRVTEEAASGAIRAIRRLEIRLGDESVGPFGRAAMARWDANDATSVEIVLADGSPFEIASGAGVALYSRAFRRADTYELRRAAEYLAERLRDPSVSRIVLDAYSLGRIEVLVQTRALPEQVGPTRVGRWLAARDLRQGPTHGRLVDGRSIRRSGQPLFASARAPARSAALRAAARRRRS